CAVRPYRRRGPADRAAALSRRAGRRHAAAAGLGAAAQAGRAAGQGAAAHIHFTELLAMDQDSVLQDKWITGYRARWAAHRAAASAGPSDGGAWPTGDAARAIACDAMIVPVVTGDLDPGALEDLVGLCVRYDRARHGCPDPAAPQDGQPDAEGDGTADGGTAKTLGRQEQQILARVIQIISGPGGLASFLRRNLLGKPLAGRRCPWTSARPTRSRCTCAGWWPCGSGLRVPRRILPLNTH
ncbi:MAG: hypothetical protein ACHP9Z_32025, partial [Streptosporangiales bacterium]